MKVRDLIHEAFRKIGVIAVQEVASAAMASSALTAMNSYIDFLKTDGFLVYENEILPVTLIPGQQTYTIGLTGDFNVARPNAIAFAKLAIGDTEYDVEVINQAQWAQIDSKALASNIPCKIYYNESYPLGQINIWPVPSIAYELRLYVPKPVDRFTSLETVISLPPGYERLLTLGTASEIAPTYGSELSPKQEDDLRKTKAGISRMNAKPQVMTCDPTGAGAACGYYDFNTGRPIR